MYRTTAAKRKSSKKSLSVPTQIFEPQQCPVYSFFTATLRHFYGAFMTPAASPSIFLVAGRERRCWLVEHGAVRGYPEHERHTRWKAERHTCEISGLWWGASSVGRI